MAGRRTQGARHRRRARQHRRQCPGTVSSPYYLRSPIARVAHDLRHESDRLDPARRGRVLLETRQRSRETSPLPVPDLECSRFGQLRTRPADGTAIVFSSDRCTNSITLGSSAIYETSYVRAMKDSSAASAIGVPPQLPPHVTARGDRRRDRTRRTSARAPPITGFLWSSDGLGLIRACLHP